MHSLIAEAGLPCFDDSVDVSVPGSSFSMIVLYKLISPVLAAWQLIFWGLFEE